MTGLALPHRDVDDSPTVGSRPTDATHPLTIRAYCLVERCGLPWIRLGHRNSRPIISGSRIHRSRDKRVVSAISKRTGMPVLLWIIEVRSFTRPAEKPSRTLRPTRSQPRNLRSTAMLNSARSRALPAISRRTRMDQTCPGSSGRFWPMMRPLFQGMHAGRTAGRSTTDMELPPVHRARPSSVMPAPTGYHGRGLVSPRRAESRGASEKWDSLSARAAR